MEFGSACSWSGMVVCTGRVMLECATVAASIKYDYGMLTVSENNGRTHNHLYYSSIQY